MAYAEDLLEQAKHLARRERTRPRQASLRRAVSTAYYALFHLLIREAVKNWKRPRERLTLSRMFEHSNMKRACLRKRDELQSRLNGHPASKQLTEDSAHLLNIAKAFTDLQHQRHLADYDSSSSWTRVDALEIISTVEVAFESWKSIRDNNEAQDFLVTLLLQERR
jgi:uncharacterized protein (UPF0332 family)